MINELRLDENETAAVLAGLRLLRLAVAGSLVAPQDILDIYSEHDGIGLSLDDIEDLCEYVNS